MSKEIAQTVGGKKIAWLIAIVAAFAVFATLSSQWRPSNAALPTTAVAETSSTSVTPGAPVSYTATATFTPSGSVANAVGATLVWDFDNDLVFVNVTGAGFGTAMPAATCANAAGNVVTCTSAVVGVWSSGALQFNFTNPATAATISSPAQCALTDTQVANCTGTPAAYDVAGVTADAPNVGAGQPLTINFTLPIGITYCSDVSGAADARAFTAADQTSTGVTVVSTVPTTAASTGPGTHSVTVTGPVGGSVTLSTHLASSTVTTDCNPTPYTILASDFVMAELRHIADDATIIEAQDVNNNVRGSRHTVCTVAEDTTIGNTGTGGAAVQIPGITLANINITNGGGYASTADTDPDFTDVRIFVGTGDSNDATEGLSGATCISWVSTDAGDQQINIVYVGADLAQYNVTWDNQGVANRALIKEWNRLENSTLTIDGTSQGTAQNVSISRSLVLQPAYGSYVIASSDADVDISDVFNGSHTNSAGAKEGPMALAGVDWTVSENGCVADVDGAASGTTYLAADGSVAGGPVIDVEAGACLPGQSVTITFTGTEPGPLGSGTGNTVTETVTITFTQNVAEKQVFLAWAGQRIILEHDWRLAPGDGGIDGTDYEGEVGPEPNGECAFTGGSDFLVQYVKGTGPGNFVPGLGATVSGNDEADVYVSSSDNSQTLQIAAGNDDDIINDPQDNCISRVLYESEDPGEVDIEAFASWTQGGNDISNYTKVAFVVYYMKINTINVSLVTQVSKPTHNASGYDYAPGNPWDASKDDADNAADWNVSKDLLVRGRVTGWFVNSNPSGRAADTSNPLNVLPANRWVMPQDWPLLAGGPADPADGTDAIGTAEQFRPYYDIMFAPNNGRGLALGDWDGLGLNNAAFVAAGNTGKGSSTSPIKVTTCSLLTAGRAIYVGATSTSVVSCTGTSLVISPSFTSAPAAGTPVLVKSGVPFEGPYSPLDIVGFAADGKGGAALSDWVPGSIRDAAKDDGDVDMWDAPMPPAMVSVAIRGTGFIKEVHKHDVYYLGTPDTAPVAAAGTQLYPNPFYIQDIPDSPFIPAVVAGGGYLWNTWGADGPGGDGQIPYEFWQPVLTGTNSEGIGDALSSTDVKELGLIRAAYDDDTIARDLVVYTDNHGEFMVTANGDFKTDLTACTTNVLAGGKHCKPGDKVGTGTITATVDYPDFRGKHFPVLSNAATVNWTWGGYKDVTVEDGETDQYKYIVFHAMDRDGFCSTKDSGAILLHSVLASSSFWMDDADTAFTIANLTGASPANARYNDDPIENVDFLIDSGEGIIIGQSGGGIINDGKQFATDVPTYSVAENDPATSGIKEFPLSSLAATGQVDECQAWIKVSNSLLGILNVLATANDDEGNIGFDKIIDLTNTTSYTLNFRWSLITWAGADGISVSDAIKGTGTSGKNPGGNDISASVTAIYGWDAAAQQWLGYFPTGVNVPGANDLNSLSTGQAYWIAITGPSSVTWTIASNVN